MNKRVNKGVLASVLLWACPMATIMAEPPSEEAMAAMMQGGMAMAACMDKIGPDAMSQMQASGEAMAARIDQLCAAGDEAGARAAALEMGAKMAESPAMKSLQACGKGVAALFQQQMPAMANAASERICD